ncbi:MAG: hypothetical protein HEP71_16725 [Roseivirga sp.]|nr:hypothetical protein [Roseivirga sp.]
MNNPKGAEMTQAMNEKPSRIRTWKELDDMDADPNLKNDPDFVKNANDWDENLGIIEKNAGGNLDLKDANSGDKVGEIKNGNILPEVGKDYAPNLGAGTEIGTPQNGYQLVEQAGELRLKRVPDTKPYDKPYTRPDGTTGNLMSDIKPTNNAHVLERHGHDVTDDALRRRATQGIAPDGSTLGNPNNPIKPFSSKFGSSAKLEQAFKETMPGSSAWNDPSRRTQPNPTNFPERWEVRFELTDNTFFGKGIGRNDTNFTNLKKVVAKYEETSPGVFKIVTMFPEK